MTDEGSLRIDKSLWVPLGAALVLFAALYAKPAFLLVRDWTNFDNPDSGTGLLLAPLAIWFAYQTGLKAVRKPAIVFAVMRCWPRLDCAMSPIWRPSCSPCACLC